MLIEVVLMDGRGCWTLHAVSNEALVGNQPVVLPGYVWSTLPFGPTGKRDSRGRPIYRSGKAAIGPTSAPFISLYLPKGWHAPAETIARRVG